MIKSLAKSLLRKTGLEVFNTRNHYAQDGLLTLHSDHFRQDPVFHAAYQRGVQASFGIDPKIEWRVHVALWAASRAFCATGDFVECGVNAGFISSAIMHKLNWAGAGKRFYLIDTFRGPVLTQYSSEEIQLGRRLIAENNVAAGAYVADVDQVRANFAEWPNAVVVQGQVPEVLETMDVGAVAFLHLDLNCAYPERAALAFFWNRLSPGAYVLLDDYAYLGHTCQAQELDALADSLGFEILALPTGQGLIVK